MAKKQGVSCGLVNTYVPSPKDSHKKELQVFLRRAGYGIPQAMRKLAVAWDGSFWIFPTARHAEVEKVREKWDGKNGVRFHVLEEFETRNPEQIRQIVRECIDRDIRSILDGDPEGRSKGLKKSLEDLSKEFEDGNPDEVDSKIVDRYNTAKGRLDDAMVHLASFALTEDFNEMAKGVGEMIEAMMVKARTDMAKKNKTLKKMIALAK